MILVFLFQGRNLFWFSEYFKPCPSFPYSLLSLVPLVVKIIVLSLPRLFERRARLRTGHVNITMLLVKSHPQNIRRPINRKVILTIIVIRSTPSTTSACTSPSTTSTNWSTSSTSSASTTSTTSSTGSHRYIMSFWQNLGNVKVVGYEILTLICLPRKVESSNRSAFSTEALS